MDREEGYFLTQLGFLASSESAERESTSLVDVRPVAASRPECYSLFLLY